MTKVKKNNLLLTLLALLLAAISAALIFMVAPKRAAKADEELPDFSTYRKITDETITHVGGLVVVVEREADMGGMVMFSSRAQNLYISVDGIVQFFFQGPSDILITDVINVGEAAISMLTEEQSAVFGIDRSAWIVSYIPHTVELSNGQTVDLDTVIFNIPNDLEEVSYFAPENSGTPTDPEEPTVLPVLSAEEGAEKLSAPQEGQMLKGKYLLIATDVADVHFIQGVLTKGENVYAFSWYVDGTAGDKNIEYTTITYNGAEYEYLLFDDNAGYEAFTYQTHNNENKTIYVSSTALLFERYGQATEEPSTEPEQDEPSSEPSTDEKKPFDLGEWFVNAGEDVSTWINENVGVKTTGSTVLIVGAIIIIIIVARKRR